jgi:hypothetical protein
VITEIRQSWTNCHTILARYYPPRVVELFSRIYEGGGFGESNAVLNFRLNFLRDSGESCRFGGHKLWIVESNRLRMRFPLGVSISLLQPYQTSGFYRTARVSSFQEKYPGLTFVRGVYRPGKIIDIAS